MLALIKSIWQLNTQLAIIAELGTLLGIPGVSITWHTLTWHNIVFIFKLLSKQGVAQVFFIIKACPVLACIYRLILLTLVQVNSDSTFY